MNASQDGKRGHTSESNIPSAACVHRGVVTTADKVLIGTNKNQNEGRRCGNKTYTERVGASALFGHQKMYWSKGKIAETYPAAWAGASNGVAPRGSDLNRVREPLYIAYVVRLRGKSITGICDVVVPVNTSHIERVTGAHRDCIP
jgi:hypothetical protein